MMIGPSVGFVVKTSMFLSWKSLRGLRSTSRNPVNKVFSTINKCAWSEPMQTQGEHDNSTQKDPAES